MFPIREGEDRMRWKLKNSVVHFVIFLWDIAIPYAYPLESHMEGLGSSESFLFCVHNGLGENSYLWEPTL